MLVSLDKAREACASLGPTVQENVIYAIVGLIQTAKLDRNDFKKALEQGECKGEDGTVEVDKFIKWLYQVEQTGSMCSVDKDDLDGIAELVAGVMEEWKAADRSSIVAEKLHGCGAGYAFKVVSNAKPSALWFKLRIREAFHPGERCLRAGAAAAAAAGISPKRYAAGGNWWCEEWGGMNVGEAIDKGVFNPENPKDAAKVGDVLACFHSIDPKWFDTIKPDILAQVRTRIPEQEQLDNFLWFCTGLIPPWFPADIQDDGLRKWAQADFFLPTTEVGKRYVTTHGDFHFGNVIMTDDGALRVIDFDFVHVHHAAFDIAYHLAHADIGRHKDSRHAFVKAYLNTSGYQADTDNVADLLVDAEIYKLGLCLRTPLWDLLLRGHPRVQIKLANELWDAYKEFVSEVRNSNDLRKDIVELGLYECIEKNSEKVAQLQRRVTARMATVDSGYSQEVLSGKQPHWSAMPFE